MFTWPASEHSQVPLAHITLRYSCHQALASGAKRNRDSEERQRKRKTERNEKDKKTDKAKRMKFAKCVKARTHSLKLNLD